MNRKERRHQNKFKKPKPSTSSTAMNTDTLALFEKAKVLFESSDYEAADELCQDVAAGAPLDAAPFHLRALIQYRLGNMNLAGEMILEAITRNDNDPEIHSNCGTIMNMLGRHMEAEAACRYVIEMTPRRAEAHSNLGVALEMQGRFDEAIRACELALEIQPNFPEAQINLGNLFARAGDLIGALEVYSTVIKQSPNNPMVRVNMSVVLLRLNEAEAAESLAHEALEINPNYLEALIALGSAYHAQKHFELAIISFEKALLEQPLSVEAGMKRAESLHQWDRSNEAICGYKALIKDNKAAGEVFCGLGRVLQKSGDSCGAIEAFQRAIEVKSSYGSAHFNLVRVLGASVDETNLKSIQRALDDPKTPLMDQLDLYFALGEALDARQEYDKAFRAFSSGNELQTSFFQANEIEFDPDVFDQQIDTIINKFKHPSLDAQLSKKSTLMAPIFILGLPHSGILNVAKAISTHTEVKVIGEMGTIIKLVGHEPEGSIYIEDIWDSILVEADIILSAHKNVTCIVDTTSEHFMYLGIIEQLFPKARIIHCHRNQTEVGLACYFENSGSSKTWDTNLVTINGYIRAENRLMKHWKESVNIPILSVCYEGLTINTKTQIQKIIKFIGLECDDKCAVINVSLERNVAPYMPQVSVFNVD
jgi:tetratricopeptide (TPR) repeat protein